MFTALLIELFGSNKPSGIPCDRSQSAPWADPDQELEKEGGGTGLRYSFDVASHGKTIEVGVDAVTGKVLENGADSATKEAKEAVQEHARR